LPGGINAKYTAYKLKLPNVSKPDEVVSFDWTAEVSHRLRGNSRRMIDDIIIFYMYFNGKFTVSN